MRKRLKKKRYKKAIKVAVIMKHSLMKAQESNMMRMFMSSLSLSYPPERIQAEMDDNHDMHMQVRSALLGDKDD